jgi:hypothetical protein
MALLIVFGLFIGLPVGCFFLWLIIESAVHNGTLRAMKEHHRWLESRGQS